MTNEQETSQVETEEIPVCFACIYPTTFLKPCALCGKQICACCRRVQNGIVCLECVEMIDKSKLAVLYSH